MCKTFVFIKKLYRIITFEYCSAWTITWDYNNFLSFQFFSPFRYTFKLEVNLNRSSELTSIVCQMIVKTIVHQRPIGTAQCQLLVSVLIQPHGRLLDCRVMEPRDDKLVGKPGEGLLIPFINPGSPASGSMPDGEM